MKILLLSMMGAGHVNCSLGLAFHLHKNGHEIYFGTSTAMDWLTRGYDFVKIVSFQDPEVAPGEDAHRKWAEKLEESDHTFELEPMEQLFPCDKKAHLVFTRFVKGVDDAYKEVIERVNPDLIMIDTYVRVPSVETSGKPWVLLCSANPLFAHKSPEAPPHWLGLPLDADVEKFEKIRKQREENMKDEKAEYDEFLISKGCQPGYTVKSPYLNIYMYPEWVDYSELGGVPDKWFRVDHAMRPAVDAPLGLDEKFFKTDSKIILFSLGSLASARVDLMNRLIGFMAESKHRFVISKGAFHEKIELPSNMIGDKYVNQVKLLPMVDLVIHHGGNNTFVETLYHGKPMIVMPLYGDQHDNGRRVEDLKIGRCLYPFKCSQEELLRAIDEILEDKEILRRTKELGEKMRNSKSLDALAEMIKVFQASEESRSCCLRR